MGKIITVQGNIELEHIMLRLYYYIISSKPKETSYVTPETAIISTLTLEITGGEKRMSHQVPQTKKETIARFPLCRWISGGEKGKGTSTCINLTLYQ